MTKRTHITNKSAWRWSVLSLLMLVMALFSAFRAAGQLALPDVVCVGSTKHYWVDPTPGSTYTWSIDGIIQSTSTHEIDITWSGILGTAGSPHTLSVQEKSVHGCYGEVKSGLVYVNPPLPVSISVTASPSAICTGVPVTFTATVINGGTAPVFNWMISTIPTGATGSTYTYQPAVGDVVTCEITSNAVCVTNNPVTSAPVTLQIGSTPVVQFAACFDTITSFDAQPYKLRGGLPLGGTYSGAGVNSTTGMFNPAASGTGAIPVAYTYTNASGCPAAAVRNIHVNATPVFTCGASFTDIRDNRTYPTIQIGTQCWLAANLDHGTRIGSTVSQADNCVNEKYCYNNDPANCTGFGALYQWDELMKYDDTPAGQGICPPGWHVPTEPEWQALLNFYNGNAFAGRPLQDASAPGFHALASGVLYQNSAWNLKDTATLFWTSTPVSPLKVISHGMNIYDISVSYYESLRGNAFPARCLHD